MRCYLAHPINEYGGSARQIAAIRAIHRAGMIVVSPDTPEHQEEYKKHGMAHFERVVASCNALAFLRFEDGMIGAGVAKEIEVAEKNRLLVFDVSGGFLSVEFCGWLNCVLTVDETRKRVRKNG